MNENKNPDIGGEITEINARMERLPTWAIPPAAKLVFVAAYFFAFYDIISIGVVLPKVTEVLHLSGAEQALPLTTSLFGYVVGAIAFGQLADKLGRRFMLCATLLLLAVSSVLCGLAWNLDSLALFRLLNGIGIGAQISLCATMINELSPQRQQARNIQLNVIAAGAGQAVAPFVAIGLMHLGGDVGWRLILGLGVLALIPVLLIRWLPESPRWLVTRGRYQQARDGVSAMEERLRRRGITVPPLAPVSAHQTTPPAEKIRFIELLKPPYLGRVLVVTIYWVLIYITTYGFFGYETVLLNKLSVQQPQGLLITALGDLALPIGAALPLFLVNRIRRRSLMGLASLVYALGLVILTVSTNTATATVGALLVTLMILVTCGVGYSYTSEIFPTRVRASVMGLADGVGHLGGVFAPFLVLAALTAWGPRGAFAFLATLMVACAIIIVGLGVRNAGHETLRED